MGIAQVVETVLVPKRSTLLNDMKNPSEDGGPHFVHTCEPSSHITALLPQCVCVWLGCQSIREDGYLHMTENKCLVNMEMWLMALPIKPCTATQPCDVFIMSWCEFTHWFLYCISVYCKMLYVRSYEICFLSSAPMDTYEPCRKPPWETWNNPLNKLKDFALLLGWWSVQR